MGKRISIIGLALAILGFSLQAFSALEGPQTYTLDGILNQAGTSTPLLDANAKLTVQIIDPTGKCLLYEEQQTVDTHLSNGYFSIHVGSAPGSAKRTVSDPGRTMIQIFQNMTAIAASNVPGQTCVGSSYTPAAGAVRYFRITVTPSATNIADTLVPDIVIDSMPNALVAQSVQGLERSGILQTFNSGSTVLTQANLEALFTTPAYANLQAILGGNFIKTDTSGAALPSYASDPAGVSNGDIWFDSTTGEIKYKSAAGVQIVGASSGGGGISSLTVGSSMSINGTVAGTISSSGTIDLSNTGITAGTYTKLVIDAKGRATSGTVSLVEGDIPNLTTAGKVSGNTITSGTISGSAAVNTSGNLITTGTVSGLTVQATNLRVYNGANYAQMTAATMSGNVNFTLPATTGSAGQFLSTDGNGILSWSGISSLLAGDVSGSWGSSIVQKIQGKSITAGSVSGQMMLYDGTQWVNNVMSGDATMSYAGVMTLNKVPVSKGGTNATTFGNNHIIASNGTGTTMVDFTCPLNQVISFDASGYAVCANVTSLAGTILNGGNTTAADISIGTNDNKAFSFKTNNTTAMTISQSGLVGIGTITPDTALSISSALFTSIKTSTTTDNMISVIANNATGRSALQLVGRSASNPWILHTGSSDTNLYFKAGSNINSSPDRFMIKGTGEVGIGTNSPTTALDVSGAITAEGMSSAPSVSLANTGAIYYDYATNKFKVSQNGGAYVDLLAASTQWTTSGSDIYYNSGRASVGTTSATTAASNLFTVYSATAQSDILFQKNSGAMGGDLLLNDTQFGAGKGYYIRFQTNGSERANIVGGQDASANSYLAFSTGTTERLRINSVGNVGVGTTAPSTALDISGAMTAQGMSSAPSVSASNTGRIYFDYSANKFKVSQNGAAYTDLVPSVSAGGGYVNGGNAFGSNATIGTTDNKTLSIITNNTTAMTISQGGAVGIGNTSPLYPLDVIGTGQVFKSTQNGGSGQQVFSLARINHASQNNEWSYYISNGGGPLANGSLEIYPTTNADMSLDARNAGISQLVLKASGYVGIGTNAPSTALTVSGATTLNGNVIVNGATTNTVGTDADAFTAITVDFTNVNIIRATAAAGTCGTLNVTNVGTGSYTLTLLNATTSCTTIQLNGSTTNVKLPASYTGGVTVAGIVYTFVYDGLTLWTSAVPF